MKNYTIYYQVRDGNVIISQGDVFVIKARSHEDALRIFKEIIQGAFVTEVREGLPNI